MSTPGRAACLSSSAPSNGKWPLDTDCWFQTVREQEAFKTEVLAALMKHYPQDVFGFEVEKPRKE